MYDFAIIILMGLAIFKVVDLLEDFVPQLASFHLLTTLALGVVGAVALDYSVFARYGVTVHVPRRPYVAALPGIPTIRVFEALACGIPLVSAPWNDAEGLFTPGTDFLVAENGSVMKEHLRDVLHDPALAASLAEHGRATILARHTCGHRVDELLSALSTLTPSHSPSQTKVA